MKKFHSNIFLESYFIAELVEMNRNWRCNKMSVSSLLLVEAGQLLLGILERSVKSSVDFLQAQIGLWIRNLLWLHQTCRKPAELHLDTLIFFYPAAQASCDSSFFFFTKNYLSSPLNY